MNDQVSESDRDANAVERLERVKHGSRMLHSALEKVSTRKGVRDNFEFS